MSTPEINIDESDFEYTSIDTESWLQAVTDEEVTDENVLDGLFKLSGYVVEEAHNMADRMTELTGIEWKVAATDNVYNSENDFSSVFQFAIIVPEENAQEWYFADKAYVMVEVHQGGDVRGNYGPIRLFKASHMDESGFIDWVLGWHVTDSSGERMDNADRFDVGYSSNPTCELAGHVKARTMHWSKRHGCFVGWMDGRAVKATPEARAGI